MKATQVIMALAVLAGTAAHAADSKPNCAAGAPGSATQAGGQAIANAANAALTPTPAADQTPAPTTPAASTVQR